MKNIGVYLFIICAYISVISTSIFADMLMFPNLKLETITVDSKNTAKTGFINVDIGIKNEDSFSNSGFFVLASVVQENGQAYSSNLLSFATSSSLTFQSATGSVAFIQVPVFKNIEGKNLQIQAQIFSDSGVPFNFIKSQKFKIDNTTDLPTRINSVNTISEFIDSLDPANREFVIDHIRSSVVDDLLKIQSTFRVNPFAKQGFITDKNFTQNPIPGNKIKRDAIWTSRNNIEDFVIKNTYTTKATLSSLDQKELSIQSQIIDSSDNHGFLDFTFSDSYKKERFLNIKIDIFDSKDALIYTYNKTFPNPGFKVAHHKYDIYTYLFILMSFILFAIFIFKKIKNKRLAKLVICIFCAATPFTFFVTGKAQTTTDNFVQKSTGFVSGDFRSWMGDHQMFSLLSPVGGAVFNPGQAMPVVVSARIISAEPHNQHTISVKHNGTRSSANLFFCMVIDQAGADSYETSQSSEKVEFRQWLNSLDFSTFNNTARARWDGQVYPNATFYGFSAENGYTHVRCLYPSMTVNTTAETAPGRHKLEIESLAGGDNYSGTQYTGIPFYGEYIRGELYYYVKPSAPTLSTTTASCGTSVDLSWTSSQGADTYKIYRSTQPATGFALVATTSSAVLTYSDLSGDIGTKYFYKVTAVHDAYLLESDSSNIVSGIKTASACDQCSNISGAQSTPLFQAYNRNYFHSLDDGMLYFVPSSAVAGTLCEIDMCGNTEQIEEELPADKIWNPSGATTYEQYSCVDDTPETCNCSGRTYTCTDNGVQTSSTPNASQCALAASCSYGSPTNNQVTFTYSATNVLGNLLNADSYTETIPTTGNGTISGTKTLSDSADGQTSVASCSYEYSNNICPDVNNPACQCQPGDTDCDGDIDLTDPQIIFFKTTPIVQKGNFCVFSWQTVGMQSCNLGSVSGSSFISTSEGKNITQTLECTSDEDVPRLFKATKTCLVRPDVIQR